MRIRNLFVVIVFLMISIAVDTNTVHAESAVDGAVKGFEENVPYLLELDSIKDNNIIVTWKYRNNYRTSESDLSNPYISISGFQLEVSRDSDFSDGNVKTYSLEKYLEGENSYTYEVPVSILGKNGGKIYARVRAIGTIKSILGIIGEPESTSYAIGDIVYGGYQYGVCWNGWTAMSNCTRNMQRDYYEYVKINKTNFPGLYKLLKDGYYYCTESGEKAYYDSNRDGWLDPAEIKNIYSITNYKYEKSSKDGKYYMIYGWNTYQCKISSLEGLEYLPWVSMINLRDYTEALLDLTEFPYINNIEIREFFNEKFTLIAPSARNIHIESETGGSWDKAKLKQIDVSQCTSVVRLSLGGSYFNYITAKLPTKAPGLRMFALSYCNNKTINLNKYTKLYTSYLYATNCTSYKISKCKQLRYAYFYCIDNLTSVDLSNGSKLMGVDVYYCKKLTPSKIKTVRTAKVTKNKGRWWESTNKYNNLWNEINSEVNESGDSI